MKFYGETKDNKFIPDDLQAFYKHVKSLNGERVVVEMKKFKPYKKRSNEQNAYYWGMIVDILSKEFGYTPEEIHEILKFKFLSKNYDFKGQYMTGTESTATLSTSEMEDYHRKIREWASRDFNIYIPEPNCVPLEAYEECA